MISYYYSLGVDPAKQKFTICLLDIDGRDLVAPRDIDASRAGYDQMLAGLRRYVPPQAHVIVGVEASCALDDNLLALFGTLREQFSVTLIRVDSAQVRRFSGPRPVRGKCDKADARRIAQFTRTYAGELARFTSDPQLLAMQRLINERLALAEELAAQKNRLRDRLVICFPEFIQVFDDPYSATALALLRNAPTAVHVAKKRLVSLAAIRSKNARAHRVGDQRAEQLRLLAASSIASATSDDDGQTMVRLVQRIELLNDQICQVEQRLQQFVCSAADEQTAVNHSSSPASPDVAAEQPQSKPLPSVARQIALACSVPGFALVSASTVVLRSQGITRFSSAKALAAQLGACPDRNQTGSSLNSSHLSYRGDRRGRTVAYLAAMACCRSDIAMGFHYWRHIQTGKTRKQALCACMNRILRILWHLIQNNTAYDPERAINNAKKHHPEQWKTFLKMQPELGKSIQKKLQKLPTEVLT